jgi:hypothetical protein
MQPITTERTVPYFVSIYYTRLHFIDIIKQNGVYEFHSTLSLYFLTFWTSRNIEITWKIEGVVEILRNQFQFPGFL